MTPASQPATEEPITSAPLPGDSLASIRVVILDDHQIIREGLKCRLQQEPDFEVVGLVATAQEAYACIATTEPDLVITDLHRPGEDCLITTSMIRVANPGLKILILSGDGDKAAADAALHAGANGFLRKEVSSDELVRAVRVIMSDQTGLLPQAAVAAVRAPAVDSGTPSPLPLSHRELSVLKRIADGLSYKEIADQMHVTVKAVEYYRAGLVKKTGCATRAQLVRYAVRIGIVSP